MSDMQQKFSLLDALSINTSDSIKKTEGAFYFYEAGKVMINDVYMLIPTDTLLKIVLREYTMLLTIEDGRKKIFAFEIDYDKLIDFHLFIRGE